MGVTPSTGQEISIGKVWAAFDNNNTRSYPPPAGSNVALRGTLGSERNRAYRPSGSLTLGTQILSPNTASLGADFWYLGTPDAYP